MSSARSEAIIARETQSLMQARSISQNQLFVGIFAVAALMTIATLFGVLISGVVGWTIFLAVVGVGALTLFVPNVSEALITGTVVLVGALMGGFSAWLAGTLVGAAVFVVIMAFAAVANIIKNPDSMFETLQMLLMVVVLGPLAIGSGAVALLAAASAMTGAGH